MSNKKIGLWCLRIGLAFVFLYAAYGQLTQPLAWLIFFPEFSRNLLSENLLLIPHASAEIILALWILSGRWITFASFIAASALFFIVIFNLGAIDLLFRDIGLFFAALALMFLSWVDKEEKV